MIRLIIIVIVLASALHRFRQSLKTSKEGEERMKKMAQDSSGSPNPRGSSAGQRKESTRATNEQRSSGQRGTQKPTSRREQRMQRAQRKVEPVASTSDRSAGSGVGAHVDSFIGQHVKSHIGNQIQESVKSDISNQVKSHLGERSNPDPTAAAATAHGSVAAADILAALRNPAGVRQAILMSEILSKPKALRRS